jgi:hypothetical protein
MSGPVLQAAPAGCVRWRRSAQAGAMVAPDAWLLIGDEAHVAPVRLAERV